MWIWATLAVPSFRRWTRESEPGRSGRFASAPRSVFVGILPALVLAMVAGGAAAQTTSCETCHRDPEVFEAEGLAHVEQWAGSVHAAVTIGCHDCHGGNPDASLADDMFAAMDEEWTENPYRGTPSRLEVPGFCGRCHSDPTYMKRFNPEARVDQVQEYWTSRHGQALEAGDTTVATCIDCHGSHSVLSADDPASGVYPTRVADTCGGCHSSAETMAGYVTDSGSPLPVDQLARWQQSVHADAMHERGDLSAPTCNDCHGNHGATPPGLSSLAFVCGQCHGREAELFRASTKHDLQMEHAEYLADAGDEGCLACHEESEPQAQLTDLRSFGECDVCHGHHGIVRPSVAMLSPLPATPCVFCHESTTEGGVAVDSGASGRRYEAVRDSLLAEYDGGESADERFDWLVDRSQELAEHTQPGGSGTLAMRPEFARLFTKFRIGKTHYTYLDPVSGEERSSEVRRCSHCHGPEPLLGEPTGWETSKSLLARIQELTSRGAEAERVMLTAQRGGVETRAAEAANDEVVDTQIELQALVHGFSAEEGSAFAEKQAEGIAFAEQALAGAEEALGELRYRRVGLIVSLVFIALMALALALIIRDLPDEVRDVEEA